MRPRASLAPRTRHPGRGGEPGLDRRRLGRGGLQPGRAGQPFTISTTSPPGGVQVTGGADQSLSLARVALNTFEASAPVWAGLTPDPDGRAAQAR